MAQQLKSAYCDLAAVVHAFNVSTQGAEAGAFQPGLQSVLQDGQDCYTEKPCLDPHPHPTPKSAYCFCKDLDSILSTHTQ